MNKLFLKKHPIKSAIIHDWFLSKSIGGGEKVTKLIYEIITEFSETDLFSLIKDIDIPKNKIIDNNKIRTSFLQNIPFAKKNIQHFLPFLPFATEQFNLDNYNLVISSSHSFCKGVITSPDQLHISYIHTPMRYAWDQMNTYLEQSTLSKIGFEPIIRYYLYKLRGWDYISGQRPDLLIANSNFTAKRIKKYWGRDSTVIHPPVDLKNFEFKNKRSNFYLSVCRLVPNKRVDLLVKAFNELNLRLYIVGSGPEKSKLQKVAKSNIIFLGNIDDSEIQKLMSTCRAFVYSGVEDFGIAIIEAMASGSPIIGYGKGGILDSVNCLIKGDKKQFATGLLFEEQQSIDLYKAIKYFEEKKLWKIFDSKSINEHVQKFSKSNFKVNLKKFIIESINEFNLNL